MSRRLSVNDRFTDVLFPETIGWKGKQPSKKEGEQDEEDENPREKAIVVRQNLTHLERLK
jgi:hypothetical protein